MASNKEIRIHELVFKSVESLITEEECRELEAIVRNDKEAVAIYSECVKLNMKMLCLKEQFSGTSDIMLILQKTESVDGTEEIDDAYCDVLHALSEEENLAPSVEVAVKEPASEPVLEKVRTGNKLNKLHKVYTRLVSLAAVLMFLFIVYANMFPTRYTAAVATVSDQIDIVWDSQSRELKNKDRIYTGQPPYILRNGIVKIKYDQGVDVLIEGPAEFEIDRAGVYLEYGRIYSSVSETGYGFTIYSRDTRFVDLGTEFGVEVDRKGRSELHVVDGKVQFYAGPAGNVVSKTVRENMALGYNSQSGTVESIQYKGDGFARVIDSDSGIIWRGQSSLDLADIVGGGTGLGTGNLGSGFDLRTGEYDLNPTIVNFPRIACKYTQVTKSRYVDGVFVPDGSEGPVVINSMGQTYDKFSDTQGDIRMAITNGPAINDRVKYPLRYKNGADFYLLNLRLAGKVYGTKESPAIYMHSNCGITFDLGEIRKSYPKAVLSGFNTTCGISDQVYNHLKKNKRSVAFDLMVLVNDECRYTKRFSLSNEPEPVSIELYPEDKYLTLVVIDTDDATEYDWCILGEPELILK